jgi:hypothetical protein
MNRSLTLVGVLIGVAFGVAAIDGKCPVPTRFSTSAKLLMVPLCQRLSRSSSHQLSKVVDSTEWHAPQAVAIVAFDKRLLAGWLLSW